MLIESNVKYIPSLVDLWNKVFGDSEEYISLFFDKAYYDSECFAEMIDGKIVSAFYLLKCNIKYEGKEYYGRYLYAAATLPEYRGKGIMSKLIKEALVYGKSHNLDFIALVPADNGLYDYYGRFGFVDSMYKYEYSINKEFATMRAYREITDSGEFCKIRNSADCNMMIYNDVCNEYAFRCLQFAGTRVFSLSEKAYYIEGEELFCADDDFNYVTDALMNNICGESVIYTNSNIDGAEKIRNGMIYSFSDDLKFKDIYMNIALD